MIDLNRDSPFQTRMTGEIIVTTVTIHKETFQRLTLLYLIGQFPKGVFSSFRLQKVLYYATRDVDPKPFTFHHTDHGQYSRDAAAQLLTMLEDGLVERSSLEGTYDGACWRTGKIVSTEELHADFKTGFPELAESIEENARGYGLMKQRPLDERVHADPILKKVRKAGVLHRESPEKRIDICIDGDDAEDLEILLYPGFLEAMSQLNNTVANTDFDISKVRKIDSLDHLF